MPLSANVTLEERFYEMFGPVPNMKALAKKLKINRATLYAAFKREKENGQHNIELATARAMARVSGRSVNWVLTGEDDSPATAGGELRAARRVAEGIARDLSLSDVDARSLVGQVICDPAQHWSDDFELYRIVRARAGRPSVKVARKAASSSSARTGSETGVVGVGEKIPSGGKR